MDELKLLRAAIDSNPEEDTPVQMYADALFEQGGRTFLQAYAHARLYQEAAIDRLHLVRAAPLVFSGSADASRLREAIYKTMPLYPRHLMVLALTLGSVQPRLWLGQELKEGAVIDCEVLPNGNVQLKRIMEPVGVGMMLLAGAGWVLHFAEDRGFYKRPTTAPHQNDDEQ